MEFWGHGGVTHFGISEGKGGLKHGSRPWLGMDIFWNCPVGKKNVLTFSRKTYNRPFPSSPGPLYGNEVKCSAFHMEMIFILMQIKLIFTRTVVHVASFWKWGFLELKSGLLLFGFFTAINLSLCLYRIMLEMII